jgi:hypothetical protein
MSDLISYQRKIDYWKVAIFKGVNGWFITVGASLAVAGILSDFETKIILVLVGGSKFLEGFIDQEVGRARQKIKEDTQQFFKSPLEKTLAQSMKLILVGGLAALLLTGCMTANPKTGADPATGKPYPAYVADTAGIKKGIGQAESAISATAPFNPYAPLMTTGAEALGLLLTVGSTALAAFKSRQATKATAVASTLAQGVVKAGDAAKSAVLEHASNTPVYAQIADHLNEATP